MGRAKGRAKHGVPFDYAARAFLDPYRLDSEDQRHDYNEERRITLGKIEGRLYAVSYTMRGKIIQLIAARKLTNARRGTTMKRYRLDPKKPRQLTPAEARRLDAMPIDYSEIPPLGEEFFTKAAEAWPPPKEQLTIRLDADVLNWLRANGRGYQTRINRILRTAMESQPPRRRSVSTAALKKNSRTRGGLKPS